MHPIDKSCVKPLCTDDEGYPLGETAQCVVMIGSDVEGSSSRPGEYAQVVPLALHDYPLYVQSARTQAVCTNDNKSRSCPWSGFVAASTAPRPPSMPTHDWIDDYETEVASLSAEVSEAKAVAEGDPTNAVKVLNTTVSSDSGHWGPTPTSAHTLRGGLGTIIKWMSSGIVQLPIHQPRALNTYYEAVAAFDRNFGHKYEATNEYEDHLSTKCKLWDIYKKILDLPEDRCTRLVGQQAFSTSLQNPFPEHDLHCVTFNNKLRDHVVFYTCSTADSFVPTLHRTMIHLVFRNPWNAEPLSIKCIRQYCKHTMWFEELEAMEAEAQRKARRRAQPSPIPTHTFYGTVDTALH
ncbi:hypothetical protein DFH08DRAFT_955714 [Mycena albidolilacea]|uniref:Uncharacterized protein n=1 Tax=Mycena albidolilacea TaxID=1033008 RepID=A0AAD7ACS8_9AGAR|nr:hypothetical protein DFH08DRAFT_955714 [Mycena albidolilacea]